MRWIALSLTVLIAACGPEPTRLPPLGLSDQCGASSYAVLLNQPQSALDGIVFPGPVRVIAPGQPVTQDIVADRVTFTVNTDGFITGIRCG